MTREEAIKVLEEMSLWKYCEPEAEAAKFAISALREQPRWISVEERLPTREDANPNESVLAIEKHDGFARSWCWDIVEHYRNEFTHWMPLPEPPKEEV